jgi:hypothetical protein
MEKKVIFKADIQKGIQEFKKVEKDFIKFERKTQKALHVSQEALNKTITL